MTDQQSHCVIEGAQGMDNHGQIVGYDVHNGREKAFIMDSPDLGGGPASVVLEGSSLMKWILGGDPRGVLLRKGSKSATPRLPAKINKVGAPKDHLARQQTRKTA